MNLNWGWRITIVYTVFAVATLGVVAFTFTHDVDLVRPDYYEHSLLHDVRGPVLSRTMALSPKPVARFVDGSLAISLPPEHANALGKVQFMRPSNMALDAERSFTVAADGSVDVPLANLAKGHWRVTVEWSLGGTPYMFEQAFSIH